MIRLFYDSLLIGPWMSAERTVYGLCLWVLLTLDQIKRDGISFINKLLHVKEIEGIILYILCMI